MGLTLLFGVLFGIGNAQAGLGGIFIDVPMGFWIGAELGARWAADR